ncbi:hypothetical protein [Spiroplasma poulsonii]|uniref:Uncharacterized protein n=1 Tax=Spiroplasma poulsonii TaxID=2138 RepID=A0A2P6F8M0_9MOLU|nr:hypothetical protein [Spiroplasma poulsonii]PQM29807.1 hypothetical protein SMSRO_SF029750 [Spiroplasma poulsonii]
MIKLYSIGLFISSYKLIFTKGVNDLTGSASFSQGGVGIFQTNDPEAMKILLVMLKCFKLAGEIIDIISSKTVSRPYNYI